MWILCDVNCLPSESRFIRLNQTDHRPLRYGSSRSYTRHTCRAWKYSRLHWSKSKLTKPTNQWYRWHSIKSSNKVFYSRNCRWENAAPFRCCRKLYKRGTTQKVGRVDTQSRKIALSFLPISAPTLSDSIRICENHFGSSIHFTTSETGAPTWVSDDWLSSNLREVPESWGFITHELVHQAGVVFEFESLHNLSSDFYPSLFPSIIFRSLV